MRTAETTYKPNDDELDAEREIDGGKGERCSVSLRTGELHVRRFELILSG
jgi:hypothetical protein